jgi:metal-responsive CopG/Arc/MetJ family transcriptional regulator
MTSPTKSKSTRVLISLPDAFLQEVDQIATEEHRSRSEVIREALRFYLRSMEMLEQMDVSAS